MTGFCLKKTQVFHILIVNRIYIKVNNNTGFDAF